MAEQKWLVDDEKVIEIDGIRKLKVGLIAGQVNIIGHDEPSTRIEVHSVRGRELKITHEGDTVGIDHVQLRWDNFIDVFKSFTGSARADVSITVPRDIALKFGVVSAGALISGLTGEATISTVSGEIIVDNLRGKLQLNSVGGEIAVRSHTGDIAATSVSGDLTVAGDIGRFTAETVSGEIFADITGIADEVRVSTVSGNVTARLAPDAPAQYRINTVSGRLQLDASEVTGVHGGFTSKYGELDGHWLEFRANTVSGNVSVVHSVSA